MTSNRNRLPINIKSKEIVCDAALTVRRNVLLWGSVLGTLFIVISATTLIYKTDLEQSFSMTSTVVMLQTELKSKTLTAMPTNSPNANTQPSSTPSPDPTPEQIVSSWKQGLIVFAELFQNGHNIYMYNLEEDTPPQLVLSDDNASRYQGPILSPDARMIAYYIYHQNTYLVEAIPNSHSWSLSDCNTPAWSPDGTYIICQGADRNLQIVDAQIGKVLRKIDHTGVLPDWSVNDEIVFSEWENNRTNIWRYSLFSGKVALLTDKGEENYAPTWSPDGQWIAYQSNQNSHDSQIWIMDRDGKNARQITNLGDWSRGPFWSPDGQWLAFVSNTSGSKEADFGEIFVISITTGVIHQVTNTNGGVYDWRVSWR